MSTKERGNIILHGRLRIELLLVSRQVCQEYLDSDVGYVTIGISNSDKWIETFVGMPVGLSAHIRNIEICILERPDPCSTYKAANVDFCMTSFAAWVRVGHRFLNRACWPPALQRLHINLILALDLFSIQDHWSEAEREMILARHDEIMAAARDWTAIPALTSLHILWQKGPPEADTICGGPPTLLQSWSRTDGWLKLSHPIDEPGPRSILPHGHWCRSCWTPHKQDLWQLVHGKRMLEHMRQDESFTAQRKEIIARARGWIDTSNSET